MSYTVTVKVSTASIVAGSDSNFSVEIVGELGKSGRKVLDPQTQNNFEKGDEDSAQVESPYLGNLERVILTTDRANPTTSDALWSHVTITDEHGLQWRGDNPDPIDGWIEDKYGGTYNWRLYQVDPAAHTKFAVDNQEKLIQDRINENLKRIDNARKQSEGQKNEEIARIQNAIDLAENDFKKAQLERQLETVTRKAKAASKGFVASVELTPNGNGYWTATTAEESASPDGPHPGFAVAGENYLEHSNGSFPGTKGLTKGVLTFRDGRIITGEAAVGDVTAAAAQGQEWAMRILTELGIPKPTKQRSIFDLLLGR